MMIRIIVVLLLLISSCKTKQIIYAKFPKKGEIIYKKYKYQNNNNYNCENWHKISIGDKKEYVEKIVGFSHSHEYIDFYYRCFYNEGTIVYTNDNVIIAVNSPKCNINISKMDSFNHKACELWNSVKNGMKLVDVKKILGDENSSRNNGFSTTLIYGKYSVTISQSNEVISVFGPECFK